MAISEEELRSLPRVYLNSQENTPFELSIWTNTSQTITKNSQPHEAPWKHRLGFIPDLVVQKTLKATTQFVPMVEVESQEHMQDHLLTHLPELKHRHINDTACCDTFFSSIPSVRGFTCWTQYSFLCSGLDRVYLMRRRSQYLPMLQQMLVDCGIPHTIHSDNTPEFKSERWTKLANMYLIKKTYMEAYHPNQNPCECRSGVLKAATSHLLLVTGAPLNFWCYALEYISLLQSVIAHRNLNWDTPHTLHFGDTPDISVFCFVFWSPMWYYAPSNSFPRSKMLPGRFIGIAHNVGDACCFLIVIHDNDPDHHQVIARSVVWHCYPQEPPLTIDACEHNSLKFYKNDGKTVLDDPVDDSGFSLKDHLLPEKPFSHSSPDMVDSSADKDDPLHDAIAEVYSPPTKCQHNEFTDPLDVASVDVDPVVSLPRPLPPLPPSGDSSKPSAQTLLPDDLPARMTPAPPVDASASTTDLECDDDPEEPIPTSTMADAAEQPED